VLLGDHPCSGHPPVAQKQSSASRRRSSAAAAAAWKAASNAPRLKGLPSSKQRGKKAAGSTPRRRQPGRGAGPTAGQAHRRRADPLRSHGKP